MTKKLNDLIDWIDYKYNFEDGSLNTISEVKKDIKDFISNWDSGNQTNERIKQAQFVVDKFFSTSDKNDNSFESIIEKKINKFDETFVKEILKFKEKSKQTETLDDIDNLSKDIKKLEVGDLLEESKKIKKQAFAQIKRRERTLSNWEMDRTAGRKLKTFVQLKGWGMSPARATPNSIAKKFHLSIEEAEQIFAELE